MNKDEQTPKVRLTNIAWPSEATATLSLISVGECKRAIFYKVLGSTPTEPMSLSGKRICDAGNMVESWCILRYKEKGCLKDSQVQIDFLIPNSCNKVQIRGRIDCIIEEDGIINAIEIKSVGEFKSAKIMSNAELPLPSPNNLMQAMLYKYYLSETEAGKALNVDNVYLRYVNRGTYSDFYYKVDLEDGWPVITAYVQAGKELGSVNLKNVKSFQDLASSSGISSSDEARLAELKINIQDIFNKLDEIYTYTKNKTLPPCDYSIVYTQDRAKLEYNLGRISKIKYNKIAKGEVLGDSKCMYCAYRTKCMSDSGITLK
jgi:CRISPR/Cas system-associated exonuclease Cas4 (RecB family)